MKNQQFELFMLEEKAYYDFRVVKLMTLPDGIQSWVLTLSGDDRFMLPYDNYIDYGIKEGQVLRCRVDKINCSGRIYLEPIHPFYNEGDKCRLIFSHEETRTDDAGNVLRILYLKGEDDELHDCISFSAKAFREGDQVCVKIVMIKKGRLILEHIADESSEHLTEGEKYLFKILADKELPGGRSLVIEGPHGIRSILDPAYYPFLDPSPGSTFDAVLVKWQPDGVPLVEPEHPIYEPGKIYPFRVLKVDHRDPGAGNDHTIIWVNDHFGNEIKVFPGELLQTGEDLPAIVNCRVLRLKRGRPVLRLVQ